MNADGGLEYYDGHIRIVDGGGNIIADGLDPPRYFTYLGEASEDCSFMKFPFYRPLGYPQRALSRGAAGAAERGEIRGHTARRPRDARIQAARSWARCANRSTTIWRG